MSLGCIRHSKNGCRVLILENLDLGKVPGLQFANDLPVLGMSFAFELIFLHFMPSTLGLKELGSLLGDVTFRLLGGEMRLCTIQVILQVCNRNLGLTTDDADEGFRFADQEISRSSNSIFVFLRSPSDISLWCISIADCICCHSK